MAEYGKGWGYSPYFEFKVPSGALCQLKVLDVADLIDLDIWDEVQKMDSIGSTVGEHVNRAQGKRPQDRPNKKPSRAEQEKQDQEQIASMLRKGGGFEKMAPMISKILRRAVVQPEILPCVDDHGDFIPKEERDEDSIYEDAISFEDKMAIFNECMSGINTASKSGKGQEENLVSLPDDADDEY